LPAAVLLKAAAHAILKRGHIGKDTRRMWLYTRLTTMVTVVKGDDAYMMAALHHYDEGKSAPEPRKRVDRR
jgi:hypothetical protein